MDQLEANDDRLYARFLKSGAAWAVRAFLWISALVLNLLSWNADYKIRRKLPAIRSDVLTKSATELRELLKTKQISSYELVEKYIARIQEVNPILCSVVQDRFEDALKDAKQVDELINATLNVDELFVTKPLLGLPVTIKETIAVKGLKHSSARTRVPIRIADEDAEVVKSIRNAGAIPLLVSNSPELCSRLETVSKNGRSRNPYDTTKSTAGSSGGEASLVASGASVIGLGSDLAGSIRVPAMFCGIYGHKPTPGYIPVIGHIPSSPNPMWSHFLTIGPMVRYAVDLPLMFNSLIPAKSLQTFRLDEPVRLNEIKVYYMAGEGPASYTQNPPSERVMKALEKAVDSLKNDHKCVCEKVNLPYLADSLVYNRGILQVDVLENVFQRSEDPEDWGFWRMAYIAIQRMMMMNNADFGAILYGPLRYLTKKLSRDMKENDERIMSFPPRSQFISLLGENAVFLYPTFSVEAQPHNDLTKIAMDISYASVFNIFGVPATQCPIKVEGGLPVGIQVVAAPTQDRLCFAVAKALETTCAGWTPPDFE